MPPRPFHQTTVRVRSYPPIQRPYLVYLSISAFQAKQYIDDNTMLTSAPEQEDVSEHACFPTCPFPVFVWLWNWTRKVW